MDNYPSLFIKTGLIYVLLGAAGLREWNINSFCRTSDL